MKSNQHTTVYVAGKSGGHIVPALTLAKQEHNENPLAHLVMITTNSTLDTNIVKSSTHIHEHHTLNLSKTGGLIRLPLTLCILALALVKSYFLLKKIRPRRIVSLGGLISVPVCLAGYWLKIPISIYELNAVPGKAVSLISRFATNVYCCFDAARTMLPCTHSSRAPYPLRFDDSDIIPKDTARERLLIPPHAHVLLVLGGSQGSRFINTFVIRYAQQYAEGKPPGVDDNLFIIHQTGKPNRNEIRNTYTKLGIRAMVFDYRHNMAEVYAAADMVVARAGAGTLFELLFFKKPTLIIPLETKSTDHQVDNARAMVAMAPGQFTVFKQAELEDNPQQAFKHLSQMLAFKPVLTQTIRHTPQKSETKFFQSEGV